MEAIFYGIQSVFSLSVNLQVFAVMYYVYYVCLLFVCFGLMFPLFWLQFCFSFDQDGFCPGDTNIPQVPY